jgi:phage shock protein PspC (stress-responsive transcriptional regulator)
VGDRLYRHPTDRAIAGVAGGLAAWLGLDPSLVRVAWVLLAIFSGGLFVLVYLVMMFVVPLPPPGWVPRQRGSGPGPAGPPPGWSPGPSTWAPPPGSTGPDPAPGAWPADPSPAPAPGWGTVPPPEGAWTAASPAGSDATPGPAPAPPPGSSWTSGTTGLVLGVVLVGLGVWFLIDQFVTIDWDVLWPVAIMVAGGALIAGAMLRNRSG